MASYRVQRVLRIENFTLAKNINGLRLVEPTPRRENLARYIIRASFPQERMTYIRDEAKIIYQSKDGREEKMFDALEWLAAMCSHVPGKGEQMVRYYGYYSNVSRGKRKKADADDKIPCILEPELTDMAFRKNWARFIRLWRACPPQAWF